MNLQKGKAAQCCKCMNAEAHELLASSYLLLQLDERMVHRLLVGVQVVVCSFLNNLAILQR